MIIKMEKKRSTLSDCIKQVFPKESNITINDDEFFLLRLLLLNFADLKRYTFNGMFGKFYFLRCHTLFPPIKQTSIMHHSLVFQYSLLSTIELIIITNHVKT